MEQFNSTSGIVCFGKTSWYSFPASGLPASFLLYIPLKKCIHIHLPCLCICMDTIVQLSPDIFLHLPQSRQLFMINGISFPCDRIIVTIFIKAVFLWRSPVRKFLPLPSFLAIFSSSFPSHRADIPPFYGCFLLTTSLSWIVVHRLTYNDIISVFHCFYNDFNLNY